MSEAESPPGTPSEGERFLFRLQITALSLLTLVLLIYLLREFQAVLKPLFVAVFLAYAIAPLHRWLVRKRVPPTIAYGVVGLTLLSILVGVGRMVYTSVRTFTPDKVKEYGRGLESLARRVTDNIPGVDLSQVYASITKEAQSADRWLNVVEPALTSFAGFLVVSLVVIVYLVFILFEQRVFSRRIGNSFSEERSDELLHVAKKINEALERLERTSPRIVEAMLESDPDEAYGDSREP